MATLKDVAEKAGTTINTVSRVINDRGYISDKMRARVREAMKELNYQPNEVARSLSMSSTRIIGVLVPVIDNPFFSEVVDELEKALTQRGYRMMLYSAKQNMEKASSYIAMLKGNQVDGIVLCLRGSEIEAELDDSMAVVSFERGKVGKLPTVVCDNTAGGRMAARELIACGCSYPVVLGAGGRERLPAVERYNGFVEVFREAGIPVKSFETSEEHFLNSDYRTEAERVFREYSQVDGVFCTSDVIAAQFIQQAMREGRRVPEDIKVIGFNDNRIARELTPPLTSVRQPIREMCCRAVEILIAQREKKDIPMDSVMPVCLNIRESTRGYGKKEYDAYRD